MFYNQFYLELTYPIGAKLLIFSWKTTYGDVGRQLSGFAYIAGDLAAMV